jgi:hypothetical protein
VMMFTEPETVSLPRKVFKEENISSTDGKLVRMIYILNLDHLTYIQRVLHILRKTPRVSPIWFVIFVNNPLSVSPWYESPS